MWRPAIDRDDGVLIAMCLELHREDPGSLGSDGRSMRRTLRTLRAEPWRGRAAVLDLGGEAAGYALLVTYWSNEFGGEVCSVDELYVIPAHRGRGHGAQLFAAIERGTLWPASPVAIALGVTPENLRARRLYERLGFAPIGVSLVKRLPASGFIT